MDGVRCIREGDLCFKCVLEAGHDLSTYLRVDSNGCSCPRCGANVMGLWQHWTHVTVAFLSGEQITVSDVTPSTTASTLCSRLLSEHPLADGHFYRVFLGIEELSPGSQLQDAMQMGGLLTIMVATQPALDCALWCVCVHIRMQSRNNRNSWTTVQGLPNRVRLPRSGQVLPVDFVKLTKAIKKKFRTNAVLLRDSDHGKIIQCQGDLRQEIRQFLVNECALVDRTRVIVHGA